MAAGFVVLLRETLEAALLVAVVVGYVWRSELAGGVRLVAIGTILGVGASVLVAVAFQRLAGGFEGRGEQTFEGIVMVAGAALLTTMIVWVSRQASLERQIERSLSRSGRWGLLLLVSLSILREGVESVIFVSAAAAGGASGLLVGSLLGIAGALILALLLFRGALRMRLRTFFALTNVILILFAAGLVARGVHELQEAELLPTVVEHVWNLNPPAPPEGPFPAMHEKGVVGSFAQSLFGYNGDPSLLELVAYLTYLAGALSAWRLLAARAARRLTPQAGA